MSTNREIKRPVALTIAISAMMSALVAASTYIIQIPVPQTGGYINVGDAMIFVSAMIFGPLIGGLSGGLGSAISDLLSPYAYFAPYTFIIKGLEGTIVGLISNGKIWWRDIIAVVTGGVVMVSSYFFVEFFLMGYGTAALVEVPGNFFQITFGGLVGIPIAAAVRRYIPSLSR
jgi:uncharacterized membrane protein